MFVMGLQSPAGAETLYTNFGGTEDPFSNERFGPDDHVKLEWTVYQEVQGSPPYISFTIPNRT